MSVCLAIALAGSISGPLRELDGAVRRFDPERDGDPPAPPPGAPHEIVVVFEHLASLGDRLRDSYGQLCESLGQGERLRTELMRVGDQILLWTKTQLCDVDTSLPPPA